jgi:VCBS repeat-containing protein
MANPVTARTSVKVATQTGAAKDDSFAALATGLDEDHASASLNVLANDPGAARLYSLAQDTSGLASTDQFPVFGTATLASGATIVMNADGTIGYSGNAASLQSLAQGESFTDSFNYTVRMANGALSTARVSVETAGVNDAPVAVADQNSGNEDTIIAGTVAGNDSDVDHGAILSYSLDAAAAAGLTFNADGGYSLDAGDDAYQHLAQGATTDVVANYTVTDEHGATGTSSLTIQVTGVNDPASISGGATGAVAEDGTQAAGGTLAVSDVDDGEAGFQPVSADDLAGDYGDFTFDGGAWTYTLRNGDANVQALNTGDTVSDTLLVTSLDGTASETINVSIAGVDELVVVVNPEVTFQIERGTFVSHDNLITIANFDSNDTLKYIQLTPGSTSQVGNDTHLTFSWNTGSPNSPNPHTGEVILVGYIGDVTLEYQGS